MNTKLQINISSELHPESLKVLKYNVLANVAANSISELTELYRQMKSTLGNEVIVGQMPRTQLISPAQLPKPAVQEPDLGQCPHCSAPLRRIVCKKYGSKNYGKIYAICPRHRTTGCSFIQELHN